MECRASFRKLRVHCSTRLGHGRLLWKRPPLWKRPGEPDSLNTSWPPQRLLNVVISSTSQYSVLRNDSYTSSPKKKRRGHRKVSPRSNVAKLVLPSVGAKLSSGTLLSLHFGECTVAAENSGSTGGVLGPCLCKKGGSMDTQA